MSKRLVFKGASTTAPPKKKKRKHVTEQDAQDDASIWTTISEAHVVAGPIMLLRNNTCLAIQGEDPPWTLTTMTMDESMEPTRVEQVWHARCISDKLTLRNCHGEFLSCTQYGEVTCLPAAGATEQWVVVEGDERGAIGFRNVYGKYLSMDGDIRCDADEMVESACFRIHGQIPEIQKRRAELKDEAARKAKQPTSAYKVIAPAGPATRDFEIQQLKRFQSWGGTKHKTTQRDVEALKTAAEEGTLGEALLDRREKIKADRYCK